LAETVGADLTRQLADWRARLDLLETSGAPLSAMRLSPAFGRAFGYYDDFLFEVRSAALSAEEPVAAGGRYDSLLARLRVQSGGKTKAAFATGGAAGCIVRPWRAWTGSHA